MKLKFGESLLGGAACALAACALAGCAAYTTPGAGVSMDTLSKADEDVAEVLKREPTAQFPAHIAIARVQASGYSSHGAQCFAAGRMCLVSAHEIETDQDFARIAGLPLVAGAVPINRMLVPVKVNSVKDLRLAAASLRAELLLLYSIDTRFNVGGTDIGPLELLTLGILPNKTARVTATASAALFDVRTGFVYGAAEGTDTEEQRATPWSTEQAIEKSRIAAERKAFQAMLGEYEKAWRGIVSEYAQKTAAHD